MGTARIRSPKKGGEAVAYTGYKRLTGSTTLGVIDNAGNLLGTMDIEAANIPDIVLLSDTLDDVRGVIRVVGISVGRIPNQSGFRLRSSHQSEEDFQCWTLAEYKGESAKSQERGSQTRSSAPLG